MPLHHPHTKRRRSGMNAALPSWFMVPLRVRLLGVGAIHEPQDRARHSVRAAVGQFKPRRARSDAPYQRRRFMVPKPGTSPWCSPHAVGYKASEIFGPGPIGPETVKF